MAYVGYAREARQSPVSQDTVISKTALHAFPDTCSVDSDSEQAFPDTSTVVCSPELAVPDTDSVARAPELQASDSTGGYEHPVFRAVEDALRIVPVLKERLADSLNVPVDELESMGLRKIRKALVGFMGAQIRDLNSIDTAYITPQLYNWAFMVQNTTTFDYFEIQSTAKQQTLRLAPNPTFRLGGYFGWRWLFLGYTFDIGGLLGSDDDKKRKTEFDLSLYTSRIGLDFYFRDTGNNFLIRNLGDFFTKDDPRPADLSDEFEGLHIRTRGFNVYYIFNHHHFSYPAAFSQSTVQRRSCGTFKLGFSFTHHHVSFDASAFDERLAQRMDESMFFNFVKYNDYELNFGYAYNWVFRKNWLLCLSVSPGLGYNVTYYNKEKDDGTALVPHSFLDFHRNRVNIDGILRLGLVYNNTKYFAGLSFIWRTFNFKNDYVNLNNSFGSLNLYVGLNFLRKKNPYR